VRCGLDFGIGSKLGGYYKGENKLVYGKLYCLNNTV
jgi:hypothetical protein